LIVQSNHGAIQGDSSKQTLGSRVGIDCRLQQNVGSDFCLSPNGTGCRGSVRTYFQLALQQRLDSCFVGKDHDHICCLNSELQAEAATLDLDEQRGTPSAVGVSLSHKALSVTAAHAKRAFDDLRK